MYNGEWRIRNYELGMNGGVEVVCGMDYKGGYICSDLQSEVKRSGEIIFFYTCLFVERFFKLINYESIIL
jgi:hypothetical protein